VSRRIDTGEIELDQSLPSNALRLGPKKVKGSDDYLGRLAKYVPAEIVGLYLATAGMIPENLTSKAKCLALWAVFIGSAILVPIYFIFATSRGGKKPLWPQVLLPSIAFPVWVFAIGGPFSCLDWYHAWIASIVLAFVTVAAGLYQPSPGS
jgi:hypothetical protein